MPPACCCDVLARFSLYGRPVSKDYIDELMPPIGGIERQAAPNAERRLPRATSRKSMVALKSAHSKDRSNTEKFADVLIRVASSPTFLLVHLVWFAVWILWNIGILGLHVFDPYPFGLLTMIVSLEAIFLSIFVLIGQSSEATVAELREELTLQVNLRMEAEVTKTLQLVAGLYTRMGYKVSEDQELREMLQALDTEGMEKQLMAQIQSTRKGNDR
jgi:uncharacterized membrane protein